jgi:hypothetical protein
VEPGIDNCVECRSSESSHESVSCFGGRMNDELSEIHGNSTPGRALCALLGTDYAVMHSVTVT